MFGWFESFKLSSVETMYIVLVSRKRVDNVSITIMEQFNYYKMVELEIFFI